MNSGIAVDSNILAYAEGVNGLERQIEANALLHRLPREATFVPVQALGELFRVLTRKKRVSTSEADLTVRRWHDATTPIATTDAILLAAMELAVQHQLQIWDAIILAAAASAGCTILLSEDLQHGFTWGGVTVVNPFTHPQHPLLTPALG